MTDETVTPPAPAATAPVGAVPGGLCASPELAPYCAHMRETVSPHRFEHVLGVAETATAIARANGMAPEAVARVALAALLHDAARDMSAAELTRLAPPHNELEARYPLMLHGRAGRLLAQSWGVTDEAVLAAIEGHVFGVSPDQRVGMCVYVADVSEPGRGVNDDVRELALHDLDAAYRRAVVAKVEYLTGAGKPIHPDTLAIYRSLGGEAR